MDAYKILIVDDDQVTAEVIRTFLEDEGYSLSVVHDAGSALAFVAKTPDLDLVVLDVILPDLNGIDVCKRLKGDPKTASVPIILISGGLADDTSVRAGLAAGADGYLQKPVEDVALRAWVKATLRISMLRRELAGQLALGASSHKEALEEFAKLSHTVNNPLQALYATVDILALSVPQSDEIEALVSEILGHAERVAQIVARASLQAKAALHAPGTNQAGAKG